MTDTPAGVPADAALRALSAATLRPAWFLVGPDAWIKRALVARLRDLTVPPEWRSLNAETIWADETDEAQAVEVASTPPFGGTRRFVLIRGVEAWRGGGASDESDAEEGEPAPPHKRRTKASKAAETPIVAALRSPVPGVVLVLTSERREAGWWKGDALYEAAAETGALAACEGLRGEALAAWVRERAAALGVALEPAAVAELLARVGEDRLALETELAKLAAWAGGAGRRMTADEVAALTGEQAVPSVFAYLDALFVEQRPARALSLLGRLLEDFHPLELHVMLRGQLRKLAIFKSAAARGMSDGAIAGRVRLPFSVVSRLRLMVHRTPPGRFAVLLAALAAAETALKRSRDGRAILEELTVECCR
jgi:DNA polymerase-3 subunit delta